MARPSAESLRSLEAVARRAWPALEEERCEGWLLRFAAGATRRSNSVHAIDDVGDVPTALARCEARYRARGLVPRFHLHPAVRPANLDDILAAAGWERELEACVQVAELRPGPSQSSPSPGAKSSLFASPEGPWLDAFAQWRQLPDPARKAHAAILTRIAPPRAFALVSEGGAPRGAGLAVAEGAWVGLFDIVTDPMWRRRGWGRFLVQELLAWGRNLGAARSYLQVEMANGPALRLYAALGFREAYRYGYRRKPS